jgi:5-oxoprolinase (ATP-hydrolysing)
MPSAIKSKPWKLFIDTGGTFTDCIALTPEGDYKRCKVLSSSAMRGTIQKMIDRKTLKIHQNWNAPDQFINGFRFFISESEKGSITVKSFDSSQSILKLNSPLSESRFEGESFDVTSDEEAPVLAARLVTQTGPEQSLPSIEMRLSTTKGTNALLERKGASTLFLTTKGFKDLLLIKNQQRSELFSLRIEKQAPFYKHVCEIPERIDADGNVIKPLEIKDLDKILSKISKDVDSVAVCLINSYKNPSHEKTIKEYLLDRGINSVSLSSELSRFIKLVPRAVTSDINAYLDPLMKSYINNVKNSMNKSGLQIMTSSGNLTGSDLYQPKDGLLSGPAGGITGAAAIGKASDIHKIISFDMGGTSTDVARYDHGFDYNREQVIGDANISVPSLAIETVAAGGGSICGFDGESLTVGPGSAGAAPGPACYGSGGPLTITDINLLTGRLDPANFHFPVKLDASKDVFHELFTKVRKKNSNISGTEILQGLLDIANEKMAQAIRNISTARGIDTANYTLVAFGGAGGQHATSIASMLDIGKILFPSDAGLLSAYGLEQARHEEIEIYQCLENLEAIRDQLPNLFDELKFRAQKKLTHEGIPDSEQVILSQSLFMRLQGQESTLEIPWKKQTDLNEIFRNKYRDEFGHWITGREIEIESLRMILVEKEKKAPASVFEKKEIKPPFIKLRSMEYKGTRLELPVYRREDLEPGTTLQSPLLILDPYSTLFAEPGWTVRVRSDRTIELQKKSPKEKKSGGFQDIKNHSNDIIKLQLYTNRFTSIASQMGEMLRRTAISVNVKERLDFSCALLDKKGNLITNAPHIPVHLGAMGLCVRMLLKSINMSEGDVILTNHPGYGGSHLPDMTVVTPVFYQGNRIGFVANRAHHSEIGGMTPGSMPPDAEHLDQEGVVFPPMYVIKNGAEQWNEIRNRLKEARWPSRAVDENLADLQAAVAANHKGSHELLSLIEQFGIYEVIRYMELLKSYAAGRMQNTLQNLQNGLYQADEKLDDGSVLKVKCTVHNDRVKFDFTGTSPTHPGNMNANPSIVHSVIIYVLRLLVDEPLPLNDGLLDPVEIILPECMLNPGFPDDISRCPAVVGGNIETSQRLVDTLLKAFELSACSQGTMNNILFGNDNFGYYETVAGGTGAGNGFPGTDGVHQHMTNTRATDPEILEHRYPVRLNRFSIKKNSGGKGKWKGGDGLIREITFLKPVQLSVLTQHRVIPPYGLKGGLPGSVGSQKIIRKNISESILDWNDSADIKPGDRFRLETPGGGGYG